MTRERAKELLPVIQAYAEGKTIQASITNGCWDDIEQANWGSSINDHVRYRIKPEPKLRPWKPEEVPVGAIIRQKVNPENRVLITAVVNGRIRAGLVGIEICDWGNDWSLANCEHSTDGGKTWKICGVEEEL